MKSGIIRAARVAALLLCLALALALPMPAAARAENKVVRIGWYETPYNRTDAFGRRSGYAYEYQQKVAAYAGWTYEYVEGSWPELLQMLTDGEIDLMSDVSYTVGRAKSLLFSMLPMGTEEYFVFVSAQRDSGLNADDFSSFEGKRFGANKNSVQADMFRKWASKKGLSVELEELSGSESESIAMLHRGEIDGYIAVDSYGIEDGVLHVCKIGSSDFFFAVSKSRPELLRELDTAMTRIQEENIYYNQQLQQKYMNYSGANMYLSEKELDWLAAHGPIRVGYLDDFLAFCAADKEDGSLTGALEAVLSLASHSMQNAVIDFEPRPFAAETEALEALQSGEVDCVFPVNLSISDAEDLGVLTTSPQMQSELCAVVRSAALGAFSPEGAVRVAVPENDPAVEIILMDHFPNWQRVDCRDRESCAKAVAEGKADCFLLSYYRLNSISGLLDRYKLSSVMTGKSVNLSFAVSRADSNLYAVMNKATRLVPAAAVNAALASWSYGEQKLTLARFMRENIIPVLTILVVIVTVILGLLLRSRRSEKQTREAMNRIAVLNTELSDNQGRLRDALTASEQASRAKTSFLSNMSHEIRTPMNAIIGLDNIALRDPNLAPRTREQLEKIGASAKHLLGIINDILDMSRIESGRMALREEEFSFRDFLDQINVMINGQCVDKGLRYECSIIGRTEDYYIGDDMKLKQVMINILGNAVKFTPAPGSVTFTVEQLQRFDRHCVLRFVMRDTGIGMSKEFIPKIFEAFSQENDGSATRYGSTGLGMAITKSIVSMMNGEITVDSEKGKGTAFTVTVTLKASERSVRENSAVQLAGQRVLIVDDDAVACEHEKLVAEAVGLQADTVRSGEEALALLRKAMEEGRAYRFVLTDYRMPGMDGLAFTRALRALDKGETGVVLLTGYDVEDKQDEAQAAGVDSISSKPLFKDNLLRCVQGILLKRDPTVRETAQAPAAEEAVGSLAGRRVLVVEDVDLNAEILIDLLELEDIGAERAENGRLAVDMFDAHPAGYYDAILMDVRMPVMNGLDASRAIRALDRPDAKQIPIIAMTANAFDDDVQLSLQAGMNAHLSKPVESERLFATLSEMIGAAQGA